jgi:hypothetical protein
MPGQRGNFDLFFHLVHSPLLGFGSAIACLGG